MTIASIFGENPNTGLDEQCVLDPTYRCLVELDLVAHLANLGKIFNYTAKFTLAAGATRNYLIIPPTGGSIINVKSIHTAFTAGPLDSSLYEDPTISALGTLVNAVNQNRNLAMPSEVLLYALPTVTAVGTLLDYCLGVGTATLGGVAKHGLSNVILNPTLRYIHRLTNNSSASATVGYSLTWAET